MGGTFHGGVSREWREFFMEGDPDLQALFKKDQKLKKQVFFN